MAFFYIFFSSLAQWSGMGTKHNLRLCWWKKKIKSFDETKQLTLYTFTSTNTNHSQSKYRARMFLRHIYREKKKTQLYVLASAMSIEEMMPAIEYALHTRCASCNVRHLSFRFCRAYFFFFHSFVLGRSLLNMSFLFVT